MPFFRIAWRNIWRNRKRTMITMAAVSLTVAILMSTAVLMEGMKQRFVSDATNVVVGEVQIHAPGFLVDRSMYKAIENSPEILERFKARNIPAVSRSYGFGLVGHETKSAGALFWGIDPPGEQAVFDLAGHMHQGRFLSTRAEGKVVLGRKLAKSLNMSVGDEMIVVVQAADGSLGNALFQVAGILKAVGDRIDRDALLLHHNDFEKLFVADGRIHEIALNSRGKLPLDVLTDVASRAAPKAEVKTWRQLLPALSDMLNLFDASIWLFLMIFFVAAALGVMNTMLMATFERIREFGVQKALGASPWRIMGDVSLEAFVLAFISTIIGLVIGLPTALYLQAAGLDLSMFTTGDVTVAGVVFDPVWRGAVTPETVFLPVVVMWAVCLLASLYPAAIAARLNPVKAMVHV